jgi:hypothetical protein
MSAVVVGCSGSGGSASSPAGSSRTEETAAAELLFSLTNRAANESLWMLQTSTSPAIFDIHGPKGLLSATVNKKDKCKYSADLASQAAGETFTIHFEVDLTGMNPDSVSVSGPQRQLVGGAVSCTLVSGSPDICKQIGPGATPALMGGPLPWVKQLATEFKANYCK